MIKATRVVVLLSATSLLAACPSTKSRAPIHEEPDPIAVGTTDLRGATLYAINPAGSDVHIQVFRGGRLARLGHNHVVSSQHVTGRVWLQSAAAQSGFELEFPVAELVVDDPQVRAAAGSEFQGQISPEDRDGTRKNMLRAEVLDAQNHPKISLQSVRVDGSLSNAQITTRITIKGIRRDVVVPVGIAVANNQLTATGNFDIQQTDFGIKPFSIGLGALEVQDRLHIVFKVVANKR